MKVASSAPAMPSAVVSRKPVGLFGPGMMKRAITPAMNPIRISHSATAISVHLYQPGAAGRRPRHDPADTAGSKYWGKPLRAKRGEIALGGVNMHPLG